MVVLSTVPAPTEGIHLSLAHTAAHINNREIGEGTLYITESCVSWVQEGTSEGFSLQYPEVALHAISKDLSAFRHECLYLMIDGKLNHSEEDGDDLTEVRFVPQDKGVLDNMFSAMNECQALHPDADDSPQEDDEAFTEEGEYELAENGDNGLGSDPDDAMETGQFEDADVEH